MTAGDELRGQRKVVTALFADVVGSTALGESLDPEDFMELVGGAVSRMVASVERFGGTVTNVAGDGVLALFGAPAAHEDDPERAVRAALDLIEAISAYAAGSPLPGGREPLTVRVGVETGLVVFGRMGGGRVEQSAMGDSVNTAARLQSAAQPGTVVVGAETFGRVADLFEWEGPLHLTLKGKSDAVHAYRVVRPRTAPAIAPRGIGHDLPLVGRDRELDTLRRAAERLDEGRGAIVLITGEPGIGKSRLLAELRRLLEDRRRAGAGPAARWLEGRCRSYGESTPYGLVQDLLVRWLEREAGDGRGKAWREALERRLGPEREERVPLFEALVPIPLREGEADRLRRLSAEERQRQTREAVSALIASLAVEPLVLAIEDLHWIDPSSQGLLARLVPLTLKAPVLIALSARNDEGPWRELRDLAARTLRDAFAELRLEALPAEAEAEMLSVLVGPNVPGPLRDRLRTAAGGNPFYLEELARSLLDRGVLVRSEGGAWRMEADAPIEIPTSVEQVIMSRLDALPGPAREAVAAAAVVGTQFAVPVLEAVAGNPRLGEAVAALEHADLVRPDPDRPGEYRFKHALIQEAAYRSLLRRRRRELHAATAEVLVELASDRVDEIAGSVALHLREAGDLAGALHHAAVAGDAASARFANAEAVAMYGLARESGLALRRQGADTALGARVARATERLGDVLELLGRHEEAREAFSLAMEETGPDRLVDRARLERRVGDTLQTEYRNEEALAQYERAARILESVEPDRRNERWREEWLNIGLERMAAHYWVGQVEEMAAVARLVEPAVAGDATVIQRIRYLILAKDLRLRRTRYVIDEEILDLARAHVSAAAELGDLRHVADAQFELGFCELFHGDLDEAEARLRESLSGAERVGDAVGRLRRLAYLTLLTRLQGREETTASLLDGLVEASAEAGVDIYLPLERANRAWLAWRAGKAADAREMAEAAVAGWARGAIAFPFQWAARWVLLAATSADGDLSSAVEHGEAMLAADQQPPPGPIALALRSATDALRAGDGERAGRHVEEALELARSRRFL